MLKKKMSEKEIAIFQLEYQQANEWLRHHDRMTWIMGTIFIPISFALLAYAASIEKHYFSLAIASIAIMSLWIGMITRLHDYIKIRFKRIFEIERALNMDHHIKIDNFDNVWKKYPYWKRLRYSLIRIHKVKWLLLLALIVAWVVIGYFKI